MKTQTKTVKGKYVVPSCTSALIFIENHIMSGSTFSVSTQDYTVNESAEDDDWM